MLAVGATLASRAAGGQRLIHDPPDGPGAAPALGAATEAPIDLAGAARRRRRGHRRTHVLVADDVAGADDHETRRSNGLVVSATIDTGSGRGRQKEKAVFTGIPICVCGHEQVSRR